MGKRAPNPIPPFFLFCPEGFRGKTGKKAVFIFGLVTAGAPKASGVARGYYHSIPTGFQFGSLRSQTPNAAPHLPPPGRHVGHRKNVRNTLSRRAESAGGG